MQRPKRGFASDNNAGVHARVWDALRSADQGHAVAYGDDIYTETAVGLFRERFGERAEVFFVFGGTGANVSALAALTRPFQAIVCAEVFMSGAGISRLGPMMSPMVLQVGG